MLYKLSPRHQRLLGTSDDHRPALEKVSAAVAGGKSGPPVLIRGPDLLKALATRLLHYANRISIVVLRAVR